jgi:hypothetical protein
MIKSYDTAVLELVEYSTLNFDIRQLESEANYFGTDPIYLAQDMFDLIAFRWNRMTRQDSKFNEYQARLEQLNKYITKGAGQ